MRRGGEKYPGGIAQRAGNAGKMPGYRVEGGDLAGDWRGSSGDCAETRWLITRHGAAPSRAAASPASAGANPSRFMPVSKCSAAGPAPAHSAISARRVQHGPQPGRLEPWRGPRRDPVEHIDDRLARHGAGSLALARAGDEEGLAAGRQQRAHDRLQPKPVGVGLDDGGALSRRAAFGEPPPIMRQRGKVDGERRGFARAKQRVRGRRGRVHRGWSRSHDSSGWEHIRAAARRCPISRAAAGGSVERIFLLPNAGVIMADGEDS